MKKVMSESTYDNKLRPGYYENNYANMAAAFVVETERWNLATELFPENKSQPAASRTERDERRSRRPWQSRCGCQSNAAATVRTSSVKSDVAVFRSWSCRRL